MVKKGEKIEQIFEEMIKYGKEQNFDEQALSKVEELQKSYTTPQIVALINQYIIPAKKEDVLEEYVRSELERYKLVAGFLGLPDIDLTEDQLKFFVQKLNQISDIILM